MRTTTPIAGLSVFTGVRSVTATNCAQDQGAGTDATAAVAMLTAASAKTVSLKRRLLRSQGDRRRPHQADGPLPPVGSGEAVPDVRALVPGRHAHDSGRRR